MLQTSHHKAAVATGRRDHFPARPPHLRSKEMLCGQQTYSLQNVYVGIPRACEYVMLLHRGVEVGEGWMEADF